MTQIPEMFIFVLFMSQTYDYFSVIIEVIFEKKCTTVWNDVKLKYYFFSIVKSICLCGFLHQQKWMIHKMYRVSNKKILKWCYIDNSNFDVKKKELWFWHSEGTFEWLTLKKNPYLGQKTLELGIDVLSTNIVHPIIQKTGKNRPRTLLYLKFKTVRINPHLWYLSIGCLFESP